MKACRRSENSREPARVEIKAKHKKGGWCYKESQVCRQEGHLLDERSKRVGGLGEAVDK